MQTNSTTHPHSPSIAPAAARFNPFYQLVDVKEEVDSEGKKTGFIVMKTVFFVDKVSDI